ncbi:MAG: right-handed parallel beta-helix repeat-containing protein [Candidatus Heimdallarchaeaceae archaeon]
MQRQSSWFIASKRGTIVISIIIIIIIVTFLHLPLKTNSFQITTSSVITTTMIPHDPIIITSNSDLATFPGSGSSKDPFRIEGFNITTSNSTGIHITGTTKYFTVQNNYIEAKLSCIYINQISENTAIIFNNTCKNSYASIWFYYTDFSTVVNNYCENNYRGIFLDNSIFSTVINNTCINNYDGILIKSAAFSTIYNNSCTLNTWGINILFSPFSNIINNTCNYSNNGGILLSFSDSSSIYANNCFNNDLYGIKLYNSDSSIIKNNVCSSYNKWGIWCESSDSINISNNKCNYNKDIGVVLYLAASSIINNNSANNNYMGIWCESAKSSFITNNTCNGNANVGIIVPQSTMSTITENTCNYNNKGIYLYYSSSFILITYNLLKENVEYGVYIGSDSQNNLIHHNSFIDNNLSGTSQAYDSGINNTWYEKETLEGNYWTDLENNSFYKIDGETKNKDKCPLDENLERIQSQNELVLTLTIVGTGIFSLIILYFVLRKKNKRKDNIKSLQ